MKELNPIRRLHDILKEAVEQGDINNSAGNRDRLCEPELNVKHYRLPGLDITAWQKFFERRQLVIDSQTLYMMHHAYGGNAKTMGIL